MTTTDDEVQQAMQETRDTERDAYWAQQRKYAEILMAYPMTAQSIETRATFRMTEDVRMPDDAQLRVLELAVSSERWLGTEKGVPHDEFEPGEPPHITARAFVRPLTKQGMPKQNEHPHWVYVPNDVVAPLLGRAFIS